MRINESSWIERSRDMFYCPQYRELMQIPFCFIYHCCWWFVHICLGNATLLARKLRFCCQNRNYASFRLEQWTSTVGSCQTRIKMDPTRSYYFRIFFFHWGCSDDVGLKWSVLIQAEGIQWWRSALDELRLSHKKFISEKRNRTNTRWPQSCAQLIRSNI